MRKAAAILTTIILMGMAGPVCSQSLADLAKKEKERRESMKEAPQLITNNDMDKFQGGAVTTVSLPAPTPKETASAGAVRETASKTGEEKPATDEPVDFQGRTETFWRQTFADARQKVAQLEIEANVLTLKLAGLQNRFYTEDDGFKQQTIQRDIQKTFYEQDLNKKNLQTAREELLDLEMEARKSGALPGWMKPGNP